MFIFRSVLLRYVFPFFEVLSCGGIPEIISCLYVPFYVDPHSLMRGVCFVLFGVIFPDLAYCSFQLVLSVGFLVRFYVASYMCWRSCCRSFIMCPEGVSCYTFFLDCGAGSYEACASGAVHTLHVLVSLLSFLCYVSGGCFLLYFLFGLGSWEL